ncbi:Dynein heavy chain [Gossypium australe]|uniref:Dynein heavy chain n=1 Tax=Gossypium australe TaxID=47621 RepID=A0A5B6WWH1_9ROSI|nr:Dynein heavy chain [Gossypium australe]
MRLQYPNLFTGRAPKCSLFFGLRSDSSLGSTVYGGRRPATLLFECESKGQRRGIRRRSAIRANYGATGRLGARKGLLRLAMRGPGNNGLLQLPLFAHYRGGQTSSFDLIHCNFRKTRFAIFDLLHCNFRKTRSAIFNLLHCNFRKEDKTNLAPLQLQGGQTSIFDQLHCNLRKARSIIIGPLPCKLRETRLMSSICFMQLQEDKICYLQSAPLQLQGDMTDVFDLLHCNFRKTRSARAKANIFDLLPAALGSSLYCKLRKLKLTSSILFLQFQEGKICCLQSTPLQLQGDKAESDHLPYYIIL